MFARTLHGLLTDPPGGAAPLFDAAAQLDPGRDSDADVARSLNAAFLIALAGPRHPRHAAAIERIARMATVAAWSGTAGFYRTAAEVVRSDIEGAAARDPALARAWRTLAAAPPSAYGPALQERLWTVFCPEAAGIRGHEEVRVAALRERRLVLVRDPNPRPLRDPGRELLFTANILLAPPPREVDLDALDLDDPVRRLLRSTRDEPQINWYDHPVRIGTAPEHNEVLYGLRHLDESLAWEVARGRAAASLRMPCVLSVSVTHAGLHAAARPYIERELARAGGLRHLDVYVVTESDTRRLSEALAPLAAGGYAATAMAEVLGVDGAYGRHYSFLKAAAALWQVCIDPGVRATFKIDLDQVFPQEALAREAGGSMFELFGAPLWGATGIDADGEPVELGLIAGALVNERDIVQGLFTPDVRFPATAPVMDERVFWSRLPQALSTEAEMMARHVTTPRDGRTACLQRIHVTGGTNGILIDALRRHRPFTPSFFGRAEDQAYLLSTFRTSGPRLGYLHRPGLIMRHDKEAFAGEAIRAARVPTAIGDLVRIVQFSGYAGLCGGVDAVKTRIDPFTGCFVSRIPRAVALLRFGLAAAAMHGSGAVTGAREFVRSGAERLAAALAFADPAAGAMERRVALERTGWNAFFESLDAAERPDASGIREAVRAILADCRVRTS
jgi:hypothetical protein